MKDLVEGEKEQAEFEGTFENDIPNGQGTLTYTTHHKEEQEGDDLHLMGEEKATIEKRVFQGQFKNGLIDGFG